MIPSTIPYIRSYTFVHAFIVYYSTLLGVQKYEVEALLRDKSIDGCKEYLVRWKGEFEPSWVKAEIINQDCPALVKQFEEVIVFLVWVNVTDYVHLNTYRLRQ